MFKPDASNLATVEHNKNMRMKTGQIIRLGDRLNGKISNFP